MAAEAVDREAQGRGREAAAAASVSVSAAKAEVVAAAAGTGSGAMIAEAAVAAATAVVVVEAADTGPAAIEAAVLAGRRAIEDQGHRDRAVLREIVEPKSTRTCAADRLQPVCLCFGARREKRKNPPGFTLAGS